MRYHHLELDIRLRGIVMTRGENGATISEMRSDYYELFGEQWPLKHHDTSEIKKYLMEIDGLLMIQHEDGLCIWYIDDIGVNVSSDHDFNNNVILIDDTVATESDKSQPVHNNSYALPAPRILTSSLVRDHVHDVPPSTSTDATLPINSIQRKRNSSQLSQEQIEKRPKLAIPPNSLLLNEENLDIHNRENGAGTMVQQTTSTELEKSISIPTNLINGCIAAANKEPDAKQLQQAFKLFHIHGKHGFRQVDSAESSLSLEEQLFLPSIGVIGDDFMRSLISFELYGADFSECNDKRFEYCVSGQTVHDAYHLVLDHQNHLRKKYRYLIVNVGAIDILLERNIIDIVSEYGRLIRAIKTIGLKPIITTIPNLWMSSNNGNYKYIYQTLLLFNQFLSDIFKDGYKFVDLHRCFSEPRNHFPSIYYHGQPKIILKRGKKLELYRWTENGRKKILAKIDEMTRCKCPKTTSSEFVMPTSSTNFE